jgi:hypothetical protein
MNKVTVGLGVQTINLTVLKRIRRGIRVATFERTFSLLQQHGIFTKIDLIIGLPGETAASIEETMEYMLNRLRHSHSHLLCFHLMRELPGTELQDIAREFGMRFSAEEQGHELIEAPDLPRHELIRVLRLAAMVFRLTNQIGWTDSEFLGGRQQADASVRDLFFAIREARSTSCLAIVRLLIDAAMVHLSHRNSRFVQPDFPHAEAWWWNNARYELPTAWIRQTLTELFGESRAAALSAGPRRDSRTSHPS